MAHGNEMDMLKNLGQAQPQHRTAHGGCGEKETLDAGMRICVAGRDKMAQRVVLRIARRTRSAMRF